MGDAKQNSVSGRNAAPALYRVLAATASHAGVAAGSSDAQRGVSSTVVSLIICNDRCGDSSEKYSTSLPKASTRLLMYDGVGSMLSSCAITRCHAVFCGRIVARCWAVST